MAIQITWNHQGFEEILTCSGTMNAVQAAAQGIQARANSNNHRGGKGYRISSKIAQAYGSRRWMYFVRTTDRKSVAAESEDKALSRAVG